MPDQRQSLTSAELAKATAAELRACVRAGAWTGPTTGLARGYVQANLVILPADAADEFAEFCRANPRPCPLLEQTAPGDPEPHDAAPGSDVRTDVPRYRVFRQGKLEPQEPTDIQHLWRDDLVSFLLGCSFTFENALVREGLPVRHIDQQRNVPMYRTNRACRPAGRFSGELVVSMRPYPPEAIERVSEVSGRFPTQHGAPIHVGDPQALGITDLERPDYGDAVTLHPGEVPVFWACGVTPQAALLNARCELAITHSPGCMFVTDWRDADLEAARSEGRAP
ncbi:MAG: putative hydro-lyase [Planctomycetota bacterium]|nr:MAG: putative hydro-lyase [Planctomycetota bacterium]